MISGLKKTLITQKNKVCKENFKQCFHSTPSVQMLGRFSSPARRYGMVFGAGWAASRDFEKTKVEAEIIANKEGGQEVFGSLSYGQTTISGKYSAKEGVSGSIKVETQSFYSDTEFNLINCSSNINEPVMTLNPNTEFLIQVSLVIGLIIELLLLATLIGFFYKYGFEKGYTTIKKKFEEIKRPVFFSLEHLFLFVLFIWVFSIDNAQTSLIDLSFEQTGWIKELHKALSELQDSV